MKDNEKIYEIANLMSNNQLFRGDVSHAAGMVRTMLSEKYISPIKKAMEKENNRSRKNPNKEAKLLSALKPFMPKENQRMLDNTINAIHMIETLRGMQNQLPRPQAATIQAQSSDADPSIHADGVYDMDEVCLKTPPSPMIPLFLVFLLSATQ